MTHESRVRERFSLSAARVLANPCADEVGPWRAFLRVLAGQPG
jgi:hypothetical protein